MSRRRKIKALRALAASTTFPAERQAALAKADALERLELEPEDECYLGPDGRRYPTFAEACDTWLNQMLREQAVREAARELNAVQFEDGWAIPGRGPLVSEDELMRLYAVGLAA